MASLTWERRDGQRMVFHLQGLETTIGRDLGNPIRIESGYVSKRHAVVRLGQQGYTIADLNSSNGTLVNGRRAALSLLKDGDRIELGAEVLTFSNPVAGAHAATPAASKKRPLLLAIVGGGGVLVIALLLLVLAGGSPEPSETPGPITPDVSAAPAVSPAPAATTGPPAETLPGVPSMGSSAGGAPPIVPAPGGVAGGLLPGEPLPSNDPAALYEMAMSHVKGKRYVEARRLLQGALRLDPGNASAQERLREVDVTINILADRHMSGGQRAFMYLRYDDAVFEWEQVLSMVDPADPRYQQAAAGVRRARERMVQK
jgi:hypothetical protein